MIWSTKLFRHAATTCVLSCILVGFTNGNQVDPDQIDSWGICLPPQNACSRDRRCRLNSTISSRTPTPAWVTQEYRDLIDNTLIKFRNEGWLALTAGFVPMGRVCNTSDGKLAWSSARLGVSKDESCTTAYASYGYHPSGTRKGTWLTQIIGNSFPRNGWTDDDWFSQVQHTLDVDFYVNVTKINDRTPIETFLNVIEDANAWNHTFKPRGHASINSTFRTDQDLINNGFDWGCCKSEPKGGKPCENITFIHQDCAPDTRNVTWQNTFSGYPRTIPLCPWVKKSGSDRLLSSISNVVAAGIIFALYVY